MENLTFNSGQLIRIPKKMAKMFLEYPAFDASRYANHIGMIIKHKKVKYKVIWGDNIIKIYEHKQLEEMFTNHLLEFVEEF